MEPLTAADPVRVGAYRLQARLGAGGMGQVYLGFSPAGRAVAVKVIRPELAVDQEFVARFGQEVAAARAVSGAYTAPVVAAGSDARPPWLATAFVAGPSLAEAVTVAGPMPSARMLPFFYRVCPAAGNRETTLLSGRKPHLGSKRPAWKGIRSVPVPGDRGSG
jgi:serine/threonine protein kinase